MIEKRILLILLLLMVAFCLQWAACGDLNLADDDDDDTADGTPPESDDDATTDDDAATDDDSSGTDLTWENFAEDFFHDYCRDCHRNPPEEGAPYSLETYDEVFPKIGVIRYHVVDLRDMPPLEDDDDDDKSDDYPSDSERQKLAEWIDAGAPE